MQYGAHSTAQLNCNHMTTGTGSEDDPIEIVDWTSFYGWGVWRTARHYGAKDSNPVATGSYEGITNYVYQNLLPTRNGPRPMLAHLENGRWRAKSFVHHDGMITPISPDS